MSTEFMQYTDSAPTPGGARKYHGQVAKDYDNKRKDSEKWVVEQRIIEGMLDDLPAGSWVLDVPCGTGRFFEFYHKKFFVYRGIDISSAMLAEAECRVPVQMRDRLRHGDILDLKEVDGKSADVTVSCRITRWIMGQHGPDGIVQMLRELQRVSQKRIIFTARVREHPFAVPYDLINSALDGWKIHRDEAGYMEDYRIIELRPA